MQGQHFTFFCGKTRKFVMSIESYQLIQAICLFLLSIFKQKVLNSILFFDVAS